MNTRRIPDLDALRAFAVMLVLWTHTSGVDIGVGGYHGVLLFFVISGFLITGILLDSRAEAERCGAGKSAVLAAFYTRRFLRIVPVYYAVLFLAVLGGGEMVRRALGWHVAYLSNWYFAYRGTFDEPTAHLWSLAIEEQFYLIWPWFVLLLWRTALPWAVGIMILAGPASRLVMGYAGANSLATWIATPTVLDALGLGCLLAWLWREADSFVDRFVRWALPAALMLFLASYSMLRAGHPSYAIFAITPLAWSLAWMWLVHRAARGIPGWPGRILRVQPLVYIGTISYGIYLVHLFVMPAVTAFQRRLGIGTLISGSPGPEQFILVSVLSIAAASFSWKYFERPINSLKNRVPYVSGVRMARPGSYNRCIADRM